MGKASVKTNKNIYFRTREERGLTRDKASEVLEVLSPERIEKIENERMLATPEDVIAMAKGYKAANLCNYYCSNECPIGKKYVPELEVKDLSKIVVEMLSSLNAANKERNNLIDIAADGVISSDEVEEFVRIKKELENISMSVETLKIWCEQMISEGKIDIEKYNECMKKSD